MFLKDAPLNQLEGAGASDISHRGSWSRAPTWQKFYNNQIILPEEKLQYALLKNNRYALKRGRKVLQSFS